MSTFRAVTKRGNEFLKPYVTDKTWKAVSRKLAFMATAWFSKTMLDAGFNTKVQNLDLLLEAHQQSRIEKRGLITVMNHSSVIDEPLCWGILPWDYVIQPHLMRWTPGADNICFKNKFLRTYFTLGQVLETKRKGAGIFQGSIDAAINILSPDMRSPTGADMFNTASNWVHIFPEGFVHQVEEPYNNTLRYFHWGVSRLILESSKPPIVVPLFSYGLENSMPEDKPSFVPRTGGSVQYNIGEPMDTQLLEEYRSRWGKLMADAGPLDDMPESLKTGSQAQDLRSQLASDVRAAVLRAGDIYGLPNDEPRFDDPAFWHLSDSEKGLVIKTNQVGRHVQ